MKNRINKPRPPAITLRDILFAIFKHKWLILLCSVLGIGGGVAVMMKRQPLYESQVKLLVRYVKDSNPVDGHDSKMSAGVGRSGESVMQSEIAILTSWDLVTETANAIGVERVAGGSGGGQNAAAASILSNMRVSSARGSNVLSVSYAHEDQNLVRELLQDLVTRYFENHLKIHRGRGDFDLVTQQADQVRTQLLRTEDELNKKKAEADVISLAEATSSIEAQRARLDSDLFDTKVALASQEARIKEYEALLGIEPTKNVKADATGTPAPNSDAPDAGPVSTPDPARAVGIHVVTKFRTITSRLVYLEKRQYELEMKFRSGKILDLNRQEISRLQSELAALVKAHPGLAGTARAGDLAGESASGGTLLVSLRADLAALKARKKMLEDQEIQVQEHFDKLLAVSSSIQSLEKRRSIEEQNYQTSQTSLGKARFNDALDSTRIPNISYIQKPTPPVLTYRGSETKIAAGLGGGGIMFGLGLALLLELVVDRRVKRPIELESRLRIPLMMSIPRIGAQARSRILAMENTGEDAAGRRPRPISIPIKSSTDPLVLSGHFINPYAGAIRDRLGYYFELNNMTHKPKLIALTGLSDGAGTTTLAAGLAAAFAEIDDCSVLYLDMNGCQPGSDELLEQTNSSSLRESLLAGRDIDLRGPGDNLYIATMSAGGGGAGATRLATKKFYDLMPKFRASQFDYVIFDMPPLGPTSPTSAMTGFMDQVILVLDAQNTDRDLLQQGYSDLARGNADVTCIFNKTRSQAPRWIQGAA